MIIKLGFKAKLTTLESDSAEEVALWRLTLLSRWSKAKFKSPCNFEESPCVFLAHVNL